MPSLLFLTTVPVTISSFFVPIARHFQAKGWQVDAMANGISTNPKCLDFDRVWEVELSRNPLDPRNLFTAPQQIRQLLAQNHYDIVNVSTPVAAFVARYALNDLRKQGKTKVIYTAQGFHFYQGGALIKNNIYKTLETIAAPWTDYLVVVNREDEAAAKRMIEGDRVRYIPGTGVNLDRNNPNNISPADIERVRQELGLTPDNSLFLSVAELIPRKRHRDLLKAFARLARSQAHLALAGEGRLLEQMKQLAADLGIQNRVHFLGFRKDIPALIRASVATILASEQEGLPNCVMESICLETPVIGSDIRGTRDLLLEGNGILVKVGDVEGLAEAMAWMLDRPEEAKAIALRGRERMNAYEFQHILKQYENLYAEVLDELQPHKQQLSRSLPG